MFNPNIYPAVHVHPFGNLEISHWQDFLNKLTTTWEHFTFNRKTKLDKFI